MNPPTAEEIAEIREKTKSFINPDRVTLLAAFDAETAAHAATNTLLGNILAVIHGDGGHYMVEHGVEKAATDALVNWATKSVALDAVTAENASLRAIVEPLEKIMESSKSITIDWCDWKGGRSYGVRFLEFRGDGWSIAESLAQAVAAMEGDNHEPPQK